MQFPGWYLPMAQKILPFNSPAFQSTLINRSSLTHELSTYKTCLLTRHGYSIMKAVLEGFSGVAPRSVVQNLIELLGTLLSRANGSEGSPNGGAPRWMKDILSSVCVSFLHLD